MIHPVLLVGAGPGDPDLITVAGATALSQADVVLSDRLVAPELRRLALNAEWIDVGKRPGGPSVSQDEINAKLIERAQQGRRVVRLKGGDPFVFGRGGEEASALAKAGLPVQVIPGVTSAVAAAAAAGIAVTDRRAASAVTVVTGSEGDGTAPPIDWQSVANVGGTIVVMMGWRDREAVIQRLIDSGMSSTTPAAAIEQATTPQQRVIRAPLGELSQQATELRPPATLVIGPSVALAVAPAPRPLAGRHVLVTRAREQAPALSDRLRALGADVIELPTIEIVPTDQQRIEIAIEDLVRDQYHFVVLTSVNGVHALWQALRHRGVDARAFARVEIAAIGRETARALQQYGLIADHVPDEYSSAALLEILRRQDLPGRSILLARAAQGSQLLSAGLREARADVDDVPFYDVVTPAADPPALAELKRGVDLITLTSPSTARALAELTRDVVDLHSTETICIGPVTAAAARELGFNVVDVADVYHLDGLVGALVRHTTSYPNRSSTPDDHD